MGEFSYISNRDRKLGIVFSLILGLTLAFTVLPSVHHLYVLLIDLAPALHSSSPRFVEMVLFALISILAFLSIPGKSRVFSDKGKTYMTLLPGFIAPVLIALGFGFALRKQFLVSSSNQAQDIFWFVICIPVGEEFLFRGWTWSIFRSLFKGKYFTLTNPLPSELIFSSFVFSIWHIQNAGHVSFLFLMFQLLYTFFTGVWLGYLRWTTGKMTLPILAHFLINLAASIPTLL